MFNSWEQAVKHEQSLNQLQQIETYKKLKTNRIDANVYSEQVEKLFKSLKSGFNKLAEENPAGHLSVDQLFSSEM